MRSPGLRSYLTIGLVLIVLLLGVISGLVEVGILTNQEVQAARERGVLAGQLVMGQLNPALAGAPGQDPVQALRADARLRAAMADAQAYTPPVLDISITDPSRRVLVHSDPRLEDQTLPARGPLPVTRGKAALRQFVQILRGRENYEVVLPIETGGGAEFGAVRVGIAASFVREHLQAILRVQTVKLWLQILLAALVGVAVSGLVVLGPLARIRDGIGRLQAGDYDHPVDLHGQDELGQLARQVNDLSQVLAKERNQVAEQRQILVTEGDTLRKVVDAHEDGLLMLDTERRVLMANRTAERLLGGDLGEITGYRIGELMPGEHPLARLVREAFSSSGRSEATPITMAGPDGEKLYLASCQIIGEGAERRGAMISLRDYSRMRAIQEMLDYARVLKRLARVAAGVAHEIGNPLQSMNIHLELLQNKLNSGDPGSATHLETLRREIWRLNRVIRGFLKLARLQDLNLARVEIAGVLNDLREVMQAEATMAGLTIQFETAPDAPDVLGDEQVLYQALRNLIRNAIQASRAGSEPIRVTAGMADEQLILTVQDHGQGMSPEVQAQAFDLYFTTKSGGTGVGLAYVQQAIEMHGGRIEVQSAPGQGTTFRLLMPALRES